MAGKDIQQNRDKVGKIGKLMRNKSYKLWRRKSVRIVGNFCFQRNRYKVAALKFSNNI